MVLFHHKFIMGGLMDKEKFNYLLLKANLSKKDLANQIGMTYGAVNNWGSNSEFPRWVESWLENYIKAKSYIDIKNKVFEIEKVKD